MLQQDEEVLTSC